MYFELDGSKTWETGKFLAEVCKFKANYVLIVLCICNY